MAMTRKIIENTYNELEEEKMQNITYLQELIQSDEKKNLEEKAYRLVDCWYCSSDFSCGWT